MYSHGSGSSGAASSGYSSDQVCFSFSLQQGTSPVHFGAAGQKYLSQIFVSLFCTRPFRCQKSLLLLLLMLLKREELRRLHVELESEEEEEEAEAGGVVVAGGLQFHKSDQAVVSHSRQGHRARSVGTEINQSVTDVSLLSWYP